MSGAVRRLLYLAVGLALMSGCETPDPVAASDPEPPAESRPPDWSELPDFDELRATYAAREDFMVVCERDHPLGAAFEAAEREAWQTLLELADGWLARCPVDIDFQMLRVMALASLGRTGEADQQLLWWKGLVESVLRSGDGRTPETAWVVISVAEEYAVLRALDLEKRGQALLPGRIDELEVERDGAVFKVYFDPAAHFRRLDRLLEGLEEPRPD